MGIRKNSGRVRGARTGAPQVTVACQTALSSASASTVRPSIRYEIKYRIPPLLADEVAQQTLSEFVRSYREGRYDRTKGRLSSWILGIAHHTALRVFRNAKREGLASNTMLGEVPDEPVMRTIWADERDRAILSRAMALLRDESTIDDRTVQAFELVALRGVPVIEAAAQCGMSADQVYVAKSRVTKRLRQVVEQLTTAFEEDT